MQVGWGVYLSSFQGVKRSAPVPIIYAQTKKNAVLELPMCEAVFSQEKAFS